jgi:5'-3' exonuclease
VVDISLNTKFSSNLGFRYSLRKNMLLTIANSYLRSCENNIIINLNSFINQTGTRHLFDRKYKWKEIPYYVLPVVEISSFKPCRVYDIEVDVNHSFLANGLCVHNCQQRSRRFKSALERSKTDVGNEGFDQNSITPGTIFMDYLSKYIDWYIRKRISESELWSNVEVIFSSDKTPGEGEHNCIQYIRHYGNKEERYCIVGVDADLIMLTLATQVPKFYILREDLYPRRDANGILNEYFCVGMENIRVELVEILRWNSEEHEFDPENAINDFVFFCFMVGNDFLPHIPSVEIMEDGIEIMLDIYKQVGSTHGHLTNKIEGEVKFVPNVLKFFLEHIGGYEQSILENKLRHKNLYFPDPLLESCVSSRDTSGRYILDIQKYRRSYCEKYFFKGNETLSEKEKDDMLVRVCKQYFEGLQWVLSYYTTGVPSWKWFYPFHYCPSASILAENIQHFSFTSYPRTMPFTPFQQLLAVLPPRSANLIPEPLCNLLTENSSELKRYCPDVFDVDVDGKKNDWEGIVILPFIDLEKIRGCYIERKNMVEQRHLQRDVLGRTTIYRYDPEPRFFRSYYGDIQECKVSTSIIDL